MRSDLWINGMHVSRLVASYIYFFSDNTRTYYNQNLSAAHRTLPRTLWAAHVLDPDIANTHMQINTK